MTCIYMYYNNIPNDVEYDIGCDKKMLVLKLSLFNKIEKENNCGQFVLA